MLNDDSEYDDDAERENEDDADDQPSLYGATNLKVGNIVRVSSALRQRVPSMFDALEDKRLKIVWLDTTFGDYLGGQLAVMDIDASTSAEIILCGVDVTLCPFG